MRKVSVVFGTRPEVIKLASIIRLFSSEKNIQLNVCFTGQHKEMVEPLLDFFSIKLNCQLNIMQPNQTLAGLSSRSLTAIDEYYEKVQPDIVFVQGDTTTAMCAAIAAFYRNIKIAHVEAGLRTFNLRSPFPEEFNRQVISRIADFHFAPTPRAEQNLLAEKVAPEKIIVTGNTVIDALLYTIQQAKENSISLDYDWFKGDKKIVLITGHRRENFGDGFINICEAIKELASIYKDHVFVYPVHLNPNVQEPTRKILKDLENVYLVSPLNYIQFTVAMAKSYLVLTDSGGVQEEAPSLGKPILIMRNTTERQEVIEAGAARLVGTDKENIIANARELLDNPHIYNQMVKDKNPFGDGFAAQRIVQSIVNGIA